MKPKTLVYLLLIIYCLLSTVCLASIIMFWGGFLDDQTTTCREDALAHDLPVYPASTRVYEEENGDEDSIGTLIRGYTSDDSFEDVMRFYDDLSPDGACIAFDDDRSARCYLESDQPFATYRVEIKVGDQQTLYQTIVEWNCKGLD